MKTIVFTIYQSTTTRTVEELKTMPIEKFLAFFLKKYIEDPDLVHFYTNKEGLADDLNLMPDVGKWLFIYRELPDEIDPMDLIYCLTDGYE